MIRKKKYKKSYVISFRISDEEREGIETIMKSLNITRVSELMRRAMNIVKETPDRFGKSCRA